MHRLLWWTTRFRVVLSELRRGGHAIPMGLDGEGRSSRVSRSHRPETRARRGALAIKNDPLALYPGVANLATLQGVMDRNKGYQQQHATKKTSRGFAKYLRLLQHVERALEITADEWTLDRSRNQMEVEIVAFRERLEAAWDDLEVRAAFIAKGRPVGLCSGCGCNLVNQPQLCMYCAEFEDNDGPP